MIERRAPAKINLGLRILRKRSDGYHDLETAFMAIPWYDIVRGRRADTTSMTCSDPQLPTDARNLCMRALVALESHVGCSLPTSLHLEKKLPYGAGLGSGSSDAATTLCLINDLWELELPHADLHKLAADLGSDVAFFLGDKVAIGTGRGEILHTLRHPQRETTFGFSFALVVVVPEVHISTADAYRGVRPHADHEQSIASILMTQDLALWGRKLFNDFEESIFPAFPNLASLKRRLVELGADYAALSGSGAAVFGVFTNDDAAKAASDTLKAQCSRIKYISATEMGLWLESE